MAGAHRGAAIIYTARPRATASGRFFSPIQLDLRSRSTWLTRPETPHAASSGSVLRCSRNFAAQDASVAAWPRARTDALGGQWVAEARGADRDATAPAPSSAAAWHPCSTPPIPTTGISTAADDVRDLLQGDRADRGARETAAAGAEPGAAVGEQRSGLQRVDQRDRIGAPLLGGDRDRRRLGDVRRQLHDQRLAGQRPERLEQGLRSPPAARRRSGRNGRSGRRR